MATSFGGAVMGTGLKFAILAIGVVAGASWMSKHSSAPFAVVSNVLPASPDKLLEEGRAYEEKWKNYQAYAKAGAALPLPSDFDRIDRGLSDTPQDWPKAEEAIALIQRMRAARPAIERVYEDAAAARAAKDKAGGEKDLLEKRRRIADLIERTYLEAGRDLYASAEGPELRTLRIKYVMIGRPFVYKVQNDATLRGQWVDMGFRKVILTDGYGKTWTLKLD